MKVLADFQCPDGHVSEHFVDIDQKEASCKDCGASGKRIISPVRCSLNETSGDFPGATMKWARDRQKKIEKERKIVAEHGPDAVW